MRNVLLVFFLYFSAYGWASSSPRTAPNGVVLLYHHVSEDTPPSTSISPDGFTQHMEYLAQYHQVVSLETMITAIQNNQPLPANAVAITFDDGYQNIAQNAHPILLRHGFPYTVFINPALIGALSQQMSWQQVRQLHKDGVTFANHTQHHKHLLTGWDTHDSDWLQDTLTDIKQAQASLDEHLGESVKMLAYPYGEFNQSLAQAVAQEGFIGFGQQSGAIGPDSDFSALPRVPAAGIYANLDTLKVKMAALAMPIIEKTINDPQLSYAHRQPLQTLTVNTRDFNSSQFSCFLNGRRLDTQWQDNRVSLLLQEDLPTGRSRINCTAPSLAHAGRFYWYSQPWFVPAQDGSWPD